MSQRVRGATGPVEEGAYGRLVSTLKKQGYHFAGRHSVVKKCHWTHMALVEGRFCYKCKFYGIESHRCIQMSPTAFWCWNACVHCWRIRPADLGVRLDETSMPFHDEPDIIVSRMIEEQRRILSGYKGHPKANPKRLEEAMRPKHVAISLTGEPTLYPRLGELIRECHKRGMTTFLVTRGVRPDVLAGLEVEPSQLYVSVESHNEEMYRRLNRPLVPKAWERTLETLKLLSTFRCPTVLRVTVIRGLNMAESDARGFAKLIEMANPTYVEVKAYMYMGASRMRLSRDNMPGYGDVYAFAKLLSEYTGMPVRSASVPSRVVLLSEHDKPVVRHGRGCPWGWDGAEGEEAVAGEYAAEDLY